MFRFQAVLRNVILCVWENESAVYNIEEKRGKRPETSYRINIPISCSYE